MNTHLSEEQIQEYALDESHADAGLMEHVTSCPECMARIKEYQLLFHAISNAEQPSLGFNVSALVMPQLPPVKAKPKPARINYLFLCIILCFIAGTAYAINRYAVDLVSGIGSLALYLIATTATTILLVLYTDMYRSFQKKVHQLDIY